MMILGKRMMIVVLIVMAGLAVCTWLPVKTADVVTQDERIIEFEISPNGRLDAVVVARQPQDSDETHYTLYLIEDNGKRLVSNNALTPRWSSDGNSIAFVHNAKLVDFPPQYSDTRITMYLLSQRSTKQITTGHWDNWPTWNTDGNAIMFIRAALDEKPYARLEMVRRYGETFGFPRPIGPKYATISDLQWRPYHQEVAYVGWSPISRKAKGRFLSRDIYVLTTQTGQVRKLTKTGSIAKETLAWSPDGRNLAYAGETPYLIGKPESGGKFTELVTIEPDKMEYHELLAASQIGNKPIRAGSLRWSPDGKQIVFDVLTLDKTAKTDIALVEWPDGNFRWLTQDGMSKLPRWSSSGHTIMYIREDMEIWSMNSDGSGNKKVYDLEDQSVTVTQADNRCRP